MHDNCRENNVNAKNFLYFMQAKQRRKPAEKIINDK
jgi:hypothetical protein